MYRNDHVNFTLEHIERMGVGRFTEMSDSLAVSLPTKYHKAIPSLQ